MHAADARDTDDWLGIESMLSVPMDAGDAWAPARASMPNDGSAAASPPRAADATDAESRVERPGT